MKSRGKPSRRVAIFFFSFMIRSGFPSKTSIAVIAALARYGGKDAENT